MVRLGDWQPVRDHRPVLPSCQEICHMPTSIRHLSPKRAIAIAISCTALVAVAIGPAFAAGAPRVASASAGWADLLRLQHLQAETVDADADELAELDAMIDPDDANEADNAETVAPAAVETPEPIETPEPRETPHPKPKATPKATTKSASTKVDEASDNDDQGENEQDSEHSGGNSSGDDTIGGGDGDDTLYGDGTGGAGAACHAVWPTRTARAVRHAGSSSAVAMRNHSSPVMPRARRNPLIVRPL